MPSSYSGLFQVAYVTTDLNEARKMMRDRHGIRRFYQVEAEFPCMLRGTSGVARIDLALANVKGGQIELIQPKGGLDKIYSEPLADATSFRLQFHHVGIRVEGSFLDWSSHLAALRASGRDLMWTGAVGPDQAFYYCDDRASLGHYTEYLWWNEQGLMGQPGIVPFNL